MIREVTTQVLIVGYAVLVVGLAWLMGTKKTRRASRQAGYERGFLAGEREGYARHSAEIDGSMEEAIGQEYVRARRRFTLVREK